MRSLIALFLVSSVSLLGATEKKQEVDIQKVMEYPIPHVLARFQKDYHVSKEDAVIYEKELKRYFILAMKYPEEKFPMFSKDVDNLWHTFLLFT